MLSYESGTYAMDEANYFGKSYNPNLDPDTRYIKMHGRKIYEFALTTVPADEELPRKAVSLSMKSRKF
jgi:3-oxoacyl-[acyl-carrier-protein] synthase-3